VRRAGPKTPHGARYRQPTTQTLWPFCSCDVPIVVGALRHEQLSPAAWRVRQLPGVVVVLVLVVVVCDPPAGIGMVSVVVDDDVVLGGVIGAAGVVVVLVVVDDDIGAGGVVCASASGAASAKPRANAPAVRSAFMTFLQGRKPARGLNPFAQGLVALTRIAFCAESAYITDIADDPGCGNAHSG
jgi:hypothetical protein